MANSKFLKIIEERGFVQDITSPELDKQLQSSSITAFIGFDCTAESEEGEELSPEKVFDSYIESNELDYTEGERGVKCLAKIVRDLGYKDSMRYGGYDNGACVGDLLEFLGDNPGAIQAVHDWIRKNMNECTDEWVENLKECMLLKS